MSDAEGPGWEPGPPSLRAMAPSMVFGAVIPLAVYYIVRHHVPNTADALIIAGAFPVAWIAVEWVRTRQIDPIGAITLFGFVVGVASSELLGGNAFVLKVKDSAFTILFGLTCLLSLRWKRPMMFTIGRAMSAGEDPARQAAYDDLYEIEEAKHVFAVITVVWGIGLIVEALLRVVLAAVLPTGPFLAVSPVLWAVAFAGLFTFTIRYSAVARERGEAELAESGLTYPSVPAAAPAD